MSGILTDEEKAYCRGLEALKGKNYVLANRELEICGNLYRESRGFTIIAEATRILACLNQDRERLAKIENKIKETSGYGKETVICGEGIEEET